MISRNQEGQITFTADDREELVGALEEIFQTEIGQTYKRDYYTSESGDEDLEKILRAAMTITGSANITVAAMLRSLELLLSAGEIRPRESGEENEELAEPEPDTRPRTKDGRLMSEAQVRWSEYRRFSETASMADINRRKQTDAGFASYVRKQLAAQMNQPIDGAVVPVGEQNRLPEHTPDQDLVAFARKYQVEPTQNLKPRNGLVILGGEQIPYQTFVHMVNRATAARLI